MEILIYSVIIGIILAILLNKINFFNLNEQSKIINLKSFDIYKIILSAFVVFFILNTFTNSMQISNNYIDNISVFTIIFGSILFGFGWALLGYCPTSIIGAVAKGKLDALFGFFGFILGVIAYAHFYPYFKNILLH